ncbi:endonuclease domain-containing protein [Novipirellula artificiosorum]|uniref:DUF559 domain-containing protein n=1 Tax=Novipirellula artificiosorum TaxID=2528016 RepID=A0A5C6CBY5_9BACT|nr:endonuclease domain-containing protein [Novipirellula artificiosorum]TWU20916.1 hypothetical protein Poly41_71690 [Novipirellula artificiosorum]
MTKRNPIEDARELRKRQTEAEVLLWSMLRAKQVCGLKFRRQYPEPPYILDFACHAKKFAVEIDGGYHDDQYEKDQQRERYLIDKGWDIIRFPNEDVLGDVESVAIVIAKHLGLKYEFKKRPGGISSVLHRQRIHTDQEQRRPQP